MEDLQHKPFAILGAGSWGCALALYLSRRGQPIRMWTFEKDHVPLMMAERTNNRYMPGFEFPETLHPTCDLSEATDGVDTILIAVPSFGFRDILIALKPLIHPSVQIAWATKGLDPHSGQLLHEVAKEILGDERAYAVLSGPSFAREVAAGLPTAVVVASNNRQLADELQERFNSAIFRVYQSVDIVGVEIGGIVKNILAIATGISDGMNFGSNARCALITRGLAEMMRLGLALGGKQETLVGLSGLGDLILTCTDNQSRNRSFGLALVKEKNANQAEQTIGQVVEGKKNVEIVVQLAKKYSVEMPIVEAVWEILLGKLTPEKAMQNLLTRTPKTEYEF